MTLPRPKSKPTNAPLAPDTGKLAAVPAERPAAAGAGGAAPSPSSRPPAPEPSRPDGGRQRALGAAISEIEKSYGKGAIMRLGDESLIKEIRGISSGSISLDLALGGKG